MFGFLQRSAAQLHSTCVLDAFLQLENSVHFIFILIFRGHLAHNHTGPSSVLPFLSATAINTLQCGPLKVPL